LYLKYYILEYYSFKEDLKLKIIMKRKKGKNLRMKRPEAQQCCRFKKNKEKKKE